MSERTDRIDKAIEKPYVHKGVEGRSQPMTMTVTTKHLTFSEMPLQSGRKTKAWSVWNHHYNERLGIIQWYGPWRQYCFVTSEQVYSLGCLKDIIAGIERAKETVKP